MAFPTHYRILHAARLLLIKIQSQSIPNPFRKHRCVLEVKVLPDTSSGEHKVKVIHVAIGSMIDMSMQLSAIVAASRN